MRKKGNVPSPLEIANFPPEIRQQFLRRIRDADPDYVRNRRKEFERQRLDSENPAQAPTIAALAPDPGGIDLSGGSSIKAIAVARLQRRSEGRGGLMAGANTDKPAA